MGWIGDRSKREPQASRRKLLPVGFEAIAQTAAEFDLAESRKGANNEHKHLSRTHSRFKSLIDVYFKEYQLRDNLVGKSAEAIFMDGALYVHAILRNQSQDELPRFTESDAERLVQQDLEAMTDFALRSGTNKAYIQLLAIKRITRLKEKDDPEIGKEIIDQYEAHPDGGPFIVGAMAGYFTIKALWLEKQQTQEITRQRILKVFRRRPKDIQDPASILEVLGTSEASGILAELPRTNQSISGTKINYN